MFTGFVNENNQTYQMGNVVEVLTAEPFLWVYLCVVIWYVSYKM